MFNIDTGLWNFHRECISKKKSDMDEFSQKLKSDSRKRHAAMLLQEDYNVIPERGSDSISVIPELTTMLFQNVSVTVWVWGNYYFTIYLEK